MMTTLSAVGSSPRGRGKLEHGARIDPGDRLIPAGAGKTRSCGWTCGRMGAHPRGGGENLAIILRQLADQGSSPRGRGKLGRQLTEPAATGLIPAGAGKTQRPEQRTGGHPAHPRGGGENVRKAISRASEVGSSPRGRGKHVRAFCAATPWGLIPAGAGKTTLIT